jgi:hypothetical protein
MILKKNLLRVFVGIVCVGSTALVFGRHFDASWAGGVGYRARVAVETVIDEKAVDASCPIIDPTRENILTCSQEYKKVTFGTSTIWMDENTSLVVADSREGIETLTFYGGRIVVNGPVTLHVRDLTFAISNKGTFVNYSWLNRLDVFAIEGDVLGTSAIVSSGTAVRFDTLVPYDDSETINANYKESSAAAFYSWVESH